MKPCPLSPPFYILLTTIGGVNYLMNVTQGNTIAVRLYSQGQDHDNKFVSLPLSGSLLIRSQYVERVLSPIWERQTGILLSLGFGFFICACLVESGYSFITKVHFALCSKALFSIFNKKKKKTDIVI